MPPSHARSLPLARALRSHLGPSSRRRRSSGAVAVASAVAVSGLILAAAPPLRAWAGHGHLRPCGGGTAARSRGYAVRCEAGEGGQAWEALSEARLAEVLLRRVETGSLVDASGAATAAGDLWRKTGAVVHVVRRSG